MSTRLICLFGLLTASLLSGCTSHPATQSGTYRTGSMIPVPKSELSRPTQTVSQDQLLQTGRTDPVSALKALVPQAH